MSMLGEKWLREEEEEWQFENKKTGISFQDWKTKKEYEYNNKNLSYYKKIARFRGIELEEGDRITNDYRNGNNYLVNDFQEDGRPICTLITNEKHDFYNKPYPFEEIFVMKLNIKEYEQS